MTKTEFISLLDILSKIVVILGFPIAYFSFWREKRKEKRDREYGTYNALDEKYLEFQKLCLEHPDLDIFDIPDSNNNNYISDADRKKEIIIFTMLISIFERAYLLYADHYSKIRKKQWVGWHTYIQGFCNRENFIKAWEISGQTFDTDFENYMTEQIIEGKKIIEKIKVENATKTSTQ